MRMTGKTQQPRDTDQRRTTSVGTATKADDQDRQSRVGKYGGDDGALEHEKAEPNTAENTGNKIEPGRKHHA
jgi:hypothetical protein